MLLHSAVPTTLRCLPRPLPHIEHFPFTLPGLESSLSFRPGFREQCCRYVDEGVQTSLLWLAVGSFPYNVHLKSQHRASLMLALNKFGSYHSQPPVGWSRGCFPAGISCIDPDSLQCLLESTVTAACCWWPRESSRQRRLPRCSLWDWLVCVTVPVELISEFTPLSQENHP